MKKISMKEKQKNLNILERNLTNIEKYSHSIDNNKPTTFRL